MVAASEFPNNYNDTPINAFIKTLSTHKMIFQSVHLFCQSYFLKQFNYLEKDFTFFNYFDYIEMF